MRNIFKILSSILTLSFCTSLAFSQITGPLKVDAGSTICYGYSGPTCGTTGYCWTAGSGTVANSSCTPSGGGGGGPLIPQSKQAIAIPMVGGGCTGSKTITVHFSSVTTLTNSTIHVNDNCGHIYTSTVSVVPALSITGVSISPSTQSITINTAPAPMSVVGSPTKGDNTYSYQWQSSTDNVNFTNTGVAGTSYSPAAISVTTYYRVAISSFDYTSYTSSVKVLVYAPINAGTITPTPINVTYGVGGAVLTLGNVSGGTGVFAYQWQSCTDGVSWSNAPSTVTSLTLPPLSTTTYYRVVVTSGGIGYSSTATINVNIIPGVFTPGTIIVPFNGTPGALNINGPFGGTGVFTYQWQNSLDGVNFVSISGAISAGYTPPLLTNTTYYRRIVYSNGFNTASAADTIIVTPLAYGVLPPTNLVGSANYNMNWSLTTTYNEAGGIVGQEKKFYDPLGKIIQTQDKISYRKDASTVYTHVFASQSLRDVYGRYVLTTLPAPINYGDFNYIPNFVTAPDGSNYSYKNFDRFNPAGLETDNTNTPNPLGGQSTVGTLGWYYGPYNVWEPYMPTSNFPYSRTTVYKDGTNNPKKSAGSGESFVMGSAHEISAYTMPEAGESIHYLQVRNKFFTSSLVGNLPVNLNGGIYDEVSKDANGIESFSMVDMNGNKLITAKPGNDITFSLSKVLMAAGTGYTASIQGTDQLFVLPVSASIVVNIGATIFYSGPASGFNISSLGAQTATVSCSQKFAYQNCPSGVCSAKNFASTPPSVHYFKILADNTSVTISGGTYTLYDMNSESSISLKNGNLLDKGYYRLVATFGQVTVSYSNSFSDVCYRFYNQMGQMIASIPPNGVKLLFGTGINNYASLTAVPFITTIGYNTLGKQVNISVPDAGANTLIYRLDGKLRFSQNSVQAQDGSFSYVNYDGYGRVVETGQYKPDASGIVFNSIAMTNILENVSPGGGLTTGVKADAIFSIFDVPDNSHGQAGYAQDPSNLGGLISTTKKYSTILNNAPLATNLVSQTWYNYDEEGKVIWKIFDIPSLGASGFKTYDYVFDGMNRLIKKTFQKNNASEIFIHYFQYDPATGNLWKVYTNTVDNQPQTSWTLQANYIYYLHGPLKRVELGTNLQGIDYTYTIKGAVKSINNSNKNADPGNDGGANGFSSDAFGLVVDYHTGDYLNSRPGIQPINGVNAAGIATESYKGNVKAVSWFTEKPISTGLPDDPSTYVYNYDSKYQYVNSTWGTSLSFSNTQGVPATFTAASPNPNRESIYVPSTTTPAYDENGNILNLQRTDNNAVTTDNFVYSYYTNTNKLASIINNAPPSSGATYASYTYDPLGRETVENLGTPATTQYIKYDVSGKIQMITRDAAFTLPIVQYIYDELGNRVEKMSYNSSNQLILATYYFDDVLYSQPVVNNVYGTLLPQEYQIKGNVTRLGIFYKQSNLYAYELSDHTGNVRAVVAKNASTYEVRLFNDYYPYGKILQKGGTNDYRYDYQGGYSEKDGETNWNAFKLRAYNPRIGRWSNLDPFGQFYSPYLAMGNNPVAKVDPTGGYIQELKNLIIRGMFISNAGYNEFMQLQSQGLHPIYKWMGGGITGMGELLWSTGSPSDFDKNVTIHLQRFHSIPDLRTFMVGGQMYTAFPDLSFKITGGLRAAFDAGVLDFDINIFSIELYNYSFAMGSRSIADGFKNSENFRFEQGLEGSLKIPTTNLKLGAELKFEYNAGLTDVVTSLNAKLGGLEMGVVMKGMENQISYNLQGFAGPGSAEKGQFALGIGVEYSFGVIVMPVANNDMKTFMKTGGN